MVTVLVVLILSSITIPAYQDYQSKVVAQTIAIKDELYKQERYLEALPLYLQLLDQGDAIAQKYLGFMYQNDRVVPQDYQQAAQCYQKAAKQGHKNAIMTLKDFGVLRNE